MHVRDIRVNTSAFEEFIRQLFMDKNVKQMTLNAYCMNDSQHLQLKCHMENAINVRKTFRS